MTHSCYKHTVWLLTALLFLGVYYGPVKTLQSDPESHELQYNKSITRVNYKHEFSNGINSTIPIVKCEFLWTSNIQCNCYNATPLRFDLSFKRHFPILAGTVLFNSCKFSVVDNILNILIQSLKFQFIRRIEFGNELIDSSLSREHLKSLDRHVLNLSFKTRNLSTLPMDLFSDVKTLKSLAIYSNSINLSHLSGLLVPLKNLTEMYLTNNLQELSGSIFEDKIFLSSLELCNGTILPSDFLIQLRNLQHIVLRGNYFSSLPSGIFKNTTKLHTFLLADNKVALKSLPGGMLSNLPLLYAVKMIACGLETIPADVFIGSKNIIHISFRGNNLHDLPLGLLRDQEDLLELDLSGNKISQLNDTLFEWTKNLKKLDLSNNQLTKLKRNLFKPLTNLDFLSLENNNLLTINLDNNKPNLGSIFDNLKYLNYLNLKGNSINEIPNIAKENFKNLTTFDLSCNKISSINCNFLRYFGSTIINVTGNPIYCDFRIMCLHQFIIQKSVEESRNIKCEFPRTLKGSLLYDLELSKLLSFPDIHQSKDSEKCTYKIRLHDSVLVMNCSHRNLSDIPALPVPDESFSNGIELFMDNNQLTKLTTKIVHYNENISLFSISDRFISELPNGFLSNLTKLKEVYLVLPLNQISEDIFSESTEIKTLQISGTNIEILPKSIFAKQPNLINLDLSRNRLKVIGDFGFRSNRDLKILRLSHNLLESLSMWVFFELSKLKKLFLNNNRFKTVDTKPFIHTKSLELLNLENNVIENIGPLDIDLSSLRIFKLKNNSITHGFFCGYQKFGPDFVDLSFNKINNFIDLSHFCSSDLKETVLNLTGNDIQTIMVSHGNDSLNCDCKTDSLVIDTKQENIYDSLRCSPSDNRRRRVSYIPQEELLCPTESFCPKNCSCWIHPANSTLIVDCSNVNLTEIPLLPEYKTIFRGGIELSVENNQLKSLKSLSKSGYKGVTKIFAAHNNITNISSEDIPESVHILNVSYNQLERLDDKVIKAIKESNTLISVLLHHNPLKCDCSSENLTRFILMNRRLFPDASQCWDGRKFKELSYSKICLKDVSNMDKVIGIVTIIILIALLLGILYSKYKEYILIWMYAHDICLCCITEEELDKDKEYDAFISYSSWDMQFVAKNLVSKLESSPNPYKLCLHDRDWPVGGYIPHQIEYSVEHSKRTIIVMSQNYLQSNWTRLEFRTAHNACMNEKRARVIVIMLDNDFKIKDLDFDLRKYIKMYTYLQWNDPWFWDKLYKALPDPSEKNKHIKPYELKVIENADTDAEMDYQTDENMEDDKNSTIKEPNTVGKLRETEL